MCSNSYDNRVSKMFTYTINLNDKESDSSSDKRSDFTSPTSLLLKNEQKLVDNKFNYKSSSVKRIELIAQKREERRQRLLDEKTVKESRSGNKHPHCDYIQMIDDLRQSFNYQQLFDNNNDDKDDGGVVDNQIIVCIRKRPLNDKELERDEIDVVTVTAKDRLTVHEPKVKVDLTKFLDNQNFRFDYVFDANCTNEFLYKYTAQPLVQSIFDGGYATCFAYGQTGSGKTYTMCGEMRGRHQNFNTGIYGLVAADIFKFNSQPPYSNKNLSIYVSFFEIYGRFAFDLLSKKQRLRILEDGHQFVQVVGLTEWQIDKFDDIINLIKRGNLIRTSGQTAANINSSRSHAIFQITLKQQKHQSIYGRISLIDLAGNERGADTMKTNRQTQLEGADINRSLLALKECIRALNRKDKHCPFRESLLTKILRDSFVGDKIRTCMIALISPNICSVEHTLNTLRYADRVKEFAINDLKIDGFSNESDNADNDDEENDNVVDYLRNFIERLTNFQKQNMDLYTNRTNFNRYEFAKKSKEILYRMLEDQKEVYSKVERFCEKCESKL